MEGLWLSRSPDLSHLPCITNGCSEPPSSIYLHHSSFFPVVIYHFLGLPLIRNPDIYHVLYKSIVEDLRS